MEDNFIFKDNNNSNNNENGIAIIGFGMRFPGDLNSMDQFWKVLIEKIDAVTDIDPERSHPSIYLNGEQETNKLGSINDWKRFDPLFFGIPPKEVATMDPQQRLLLKVAWETMEDMLYQENPGESTSLEPNWVKVCVGSVSLSPTGQKYKEDMDTLFNKTQYFTTLSPDEIYRSIKINTKMEYGPQFQLILEAKLGQDVILSKVTMEKETSVFDGQSFFNIPILDNTHISLLMSQFPDGCIYQGFENLKLYVSNLPKNRSETKIVYLKSGYLKWNGKCFVFSVRFLKKDGTVLLEIEKVKIATLSKNVKDLPIKHPTNELFSSFWQSKEYPNINHQLDQEFENFTHKFIWLKAKSYYPYLVNILYKEVQVKDSNFARDLISGNQSVQELESKYLKEEKWKYLFRLVCTFIRDNYQMIQKDFDINQNQLVIKELISEYPGLYEALYFDKALPMIAEFLFGGDSSKILSQALFTDGTLQNFYSCQLAWDYLQLNARTIGSLLRPIVVNNQEKRIIRILELGSGTGTQSAYILEELTKLLDENKSANLEIEYTFTDISSSFFIEAKQIFSKFNSDRINIVYRVADITKEFPSQGYHNGYYDIVVMYLVLHVANYLESSLANIYKLIKPGGKLLFTELISDSITQNLIIGILDGWWGFKDYELRPDHCCLKQETWKTLLKKHGLINTVMTPELKDCIFNPFTVLTHKPTIDQIVSQQQLSIRTMTTHQYNQCILYCNNNRSENNKQFIEQLKEFYNNISKSVSIINNIDEMKRLTLSDQDIIIFTVGIEALTQDNFINIDMEYTSINQILYSGSIRCKHVLLTLNAQLESENYLNSSLIGIYRSFCEFKELNNYSIDIDQLNQKYIPTIEYISNQDHYVEREFAIRNGQVMVENWNKETKAQPSSSFETNNLGFKLDINLEPKLKSFNPELQKDQVLVRVKSSALNHRDTIYHRGIGDIDPVIEFSGDVIKVHESVTNFKVGDSVLGISKTTQVQLIGKGEIGLIPIKEYPISQVKDAYNFMIERKNIGKIVLSDLDDSTLNQIIQKQLIVKKPIIKQNYSINQNNLGQTGVALETIKWIIKYSKEPVNIIVLSQSTIKFELEFIKNQVQYENGQHQSRIHFRQVDISKINQVRNAINDVYNSNSKIEPVESIFHFAFALADCIPQDLSLQHFEKGHSAKTIGALNLHNISIEFKWRLKNFILNSSVASTNGSKYQCAYISANSVTSSFSKYRRSLGLPCTTIIWGALSTGSIHETVTMSKKFELLGYKMVSVVKILGCIDYALEHNKQDVLCVKFISIAGFEPLLYAWDFTRNKYFNPHENPERTMINNSNEDSIENKIINQFASVLYIKPKSERLILREILKTDTESILSYRSTPEIAKYQYWEPFNSETIVPFIDKCLNPNFNDRDQWIGLAIISKQDNNNNDDGILIGDCAFNLHSLDTDNQVVIVELGINVSPNHQNKGLQCTD
eukprot:gene8480-10421_t